jgi:hypothetical protein
MFSLVKWKWHQFRTKHHAFYWTHVSYEPNSPQRRRCTRCGKVF